MDTLQNFLDAASGFVWGPFLLVPLLVGTGLYLTIRLGGLQFLKLIPALRLGIVKRRDAGSEGDITQFQALTTALAATVGTGNIVGVATAIGIGGPGALFWMWVTGLVGMASKYSEAFLAAFDEWILGWALRALRARRRLRALPAALAVFLRGPLHNWVKRRRFS